MMIWVIICRALNGHMAELVDALVSGTSGSDTLEVRVLVGRALRSQCRGREFESHQLHQLFWTHDTK